MTTLKELFENSYRTRLEALGRSLSSIKGMQYALDRWNRIIGDVPIATITDEMMYEFAVGLKKIVWRGHPVSPCTVRKELRNIRTLLNFAIKKGVIVKKPEIIMPAERLRYAKDVFTFEEIQAIIKATSTLEGEWLVSGGRDSYRYKINAAVWWKSLVSFVYYTAVRIGTAVEIRFDWVENNIVNIQETEGVKTCYVLPLHDNAREIIRTMCRLHDEPVIFPWPFNKRHLHKCFKRLAVAAGLPPERQFGFHAIRKHTGSNMAKVDFAAAVKLLGHSAPNVTTKYYLNADQTCGDAIQKIKPLDGDGKGGEV